MVLVGRHGVTLAAFFLLTALFETTDIHVHAAAAPPRVRRSGESSSNVVKFTKKQKQGVKNNVLASTDDSDAFNFQNSLTSGANDIYVADIFIDGKKYEVQLDTGSSDLWIDTTDVSFSSSVQSTGRIGTVRYLDTTSASGTIVLAPTTFGNMSVTQALISARGTNATHNGDNGLLGLGLPGISQVRSTLFFTDFNGDTLLSNIFALNQTQSNILAFQLSRSLSSGSSDGGSFSIGEIDSDFQEVQNAQKLAIVGAGDRWTVLCDGIVVNGKTLSGNSNFIQFNSQSTQTIANLDSGTSLAILPKFYLDAIYADIPGAQLQNSNGLLVYQVPCDTKIDLKFIFGGVQYPIHPIDSLIAVSNGQGGVVCGSGFLGTSQSLGTEDMLLGDTFLRNVYALYDYGSLGFTTARARSLSLEARAGSLTSIAPFIQLLSTTNATQASNEFNSLSQTRNASLITGRSSPSSSSGQRSRNLPFSSSSSNSFFVLSISLPLVFSLVFFQGLGLSSLGLS